MSGCGKGCAGCLLAIPVLLVYNWIINKFVFWVFYTCLNF